MADAPEDVVAAIDVGTNSVHLLVARTNGDGRFEPIAREKETVRLGHGSGEMKLLDEDAMDRGVAALRRFRQVADVSDAHIYAVGTSAVREAQNREAFLDRARREAGVEVEPISGTEEARLIYLGALQATPIFDQQALVVDIGGGSTELVIGHRGQVVEPASVKLGAIRLTSRFFPDGVVEERSVRECRAYVAAALGAAARRIGRHRFDVAVGCSGTIRALAEMATVGRSGSDGPTGDHVLVTAELSSVTSALLSARRPKDRLALPGLDAGRADIIAAGAILLEQIFASFGIEELSVSDYALREGVLLDALERSSTGPIHHHLRDVRGRGVRHLAGLCPDELPHAEHVATLALQLYDGCLDGEGSAADREYLEAAALLANVGLVVSHTAHHKHSYYVIRNSERLTGFTSHEVELIALVARYHRKSAPKARHPEFARLSDDDQATVRRLAAVLRVATGLDRTYAGRVRSVACHREDGELVVAVDAAGADISLELVTADASKGLLERVLGTEVRFRAT